MVGQEIKDDRAQLGRDRGLDVVRGENGGNVVKEGKVVIRCVERAKKGGQEGRRKVDWRKTRKGKSQ